MPNKIFVGGVPITVTEAGEFLSKLAPHNLQASRALRLMKGCRFPLSKAPCRYLRMFMWRLSHWILA